MHGGNKAQVYLERVLDEDRETSILPRTIGY
jgi:hypothetical protein